MGKVVKLRDPKKLLSARRAARTVPLMILMFLGRVGGLTVIYAAVTGSGDKMSKLPAEQITVG